MKDIKMLSEAKSRQKSGKKITITLIALLSLTTVISAQNIALTIDSGGKFSINTDKFVIEEASGYVGIGTSDLAYKFEIQDGRINFINPEVGFYSPVLSVNGYEALSFTEYYGFRWGRGRHNYFPRSAQFGGSIEAELPESNYQLSAISNHPSNVLAKIENTSIADDADGLLIMIGPDSNPTNTNEYIRFVNGNGSRVGWIAGDGLGSIIYAIQSDARLKMNISDLPSALEKVSNIRVRQYETKSAPGIQQIGFIAQELQKIFPQAVSGEPDSDVDENSMGIDYGRSMGIDYGRITPLLVKAIQELQAEIEQLKSR